MNELDDLYNKSDKPVDEEMLMKYLNGELAHEEAYEIEKQMAESDFLNDAVEGLQNSVNKHAIKTNVISLNKKLDKKLLKRRSDKRTASLSSWVIIAVVILLLLVLAGYAVVHYSAGF